MRGTVLVLDPYAESTPLVATLKSEGYDVVQEPDTVRALERAARDDLHPSSVVEELVTADEMERRYVLHVLDVVKGNKSRAARILGFDRRTLYRKLERGSGHTGSTELDAEGEPVSDVTESPIRTGT